MSVTRRGFLGALGVLIGAPAVVRASSLMPVRSVDLTCVGFRFTQVEGTAELLLKLLEQAGVHSLRVGSVREVWSNAARIQLPNGLRCGEILVRRGTLELMSGSEVPCQSIIFLSEDV